MVFGNLSTHYLGRPNDFTIATGELIHKARIEAGLSQADLANRTMQRQATISDMENGKVEVSASELLHLSQALEKPILYFFPDWTIQKISVDNMPSTLQNLVLHAQKLAPEDLQKIVIQIKALVNFVREDS